MFNVAGQLGSVRFRLPSGAGQMNCRVNWTHLNQDSVSTVGVQVNPDFVLRQAIILVHGEGVSFIHNIALHCGTPLTAQAKLTSTETCTYMLPHCSLHA